MTQDICDVMTSGHHRNVAYLAKMMREAVVSLAVVEVRIRSRI